MIKAKVHLEPAAEQVWEHYGYPVEFNRRIKCPCRKDNHPSCQFWQSKTGKIYLHDFASGDMYDSTGLVMRLFNLDYAGAKQHISKEEFKPVKIVYTKQQLEYVVVEDKLEDYRSYWDKFYIPMEVVTKYATVARSVYINETFKARSTKANPIFVYRFPSGKLKLYRPLSPDPDKKWAGNSDMYDVGGMTQLPRKGKVCIVTSSIKDVMVLRQHGFPAICFNGESYGTNENSDSGKLVKQTITSLKKRFAHVVIMLDNDEPGRTASAKISRITNTAEVLLHGSKDISDFQKKYKPQKTFRTLKKSLAKTFHAKA